jgi:hypothetical protein
MTMTGRRETTLHCRCRARGRVVERLAYHFLGDTSLVYAFDIFLAATL